MTHAELVSRAVRWLQNTRGCSVVFSEMRHAAAEAPDAIGWQNFTSILIECKVSRSDFLADKSKPFRRVPEIGLGCERYFMAPAGLLTVADLPDKWGLLEVKGKRVYVTRKSGGFVMRNRMGEIGFLVSMLNRCAYRVNEPLHEFLKWAQ